MFSDAADFHVYEDEDKKIYNASLMLSDIKKNNNKYYIIQLLQSDKNVTDYILWNRWGRVGKKGQTADTRYYSSKDGIKAYEKKYKDKKRTGYSEIEISYEEDKEKDKDKDKYKDKDEDKKEEVEKSEDKKSKKDDIESKLDKRVQQLIRLIFNMKMIQRQMTEIGYDAKKLPLGKLSKETIKKGYEVLKKIADALDETKVDEDELADLSSEFYTTIPHDFGFKKMRLFTIDTKEKLKKKLEMLQTLGDIEIASRLIESIKEENSLDANYSKLHCGIAPVELDVRIELNRIERGL